MVATLRVTSPRRAASASAAPNHADGSRRRSWGGGLGHRRGGGACRTALRSAGSAAGAVRLCRAGEDVELHVALIAPIGAGSEVQLLGREPLGREVGAKRQRSGRTDPCLFLGGELAGEQFGLGAVGAGGMPASQLLSGDRVSAFVDHGVETASPLGYVTVHECPPSIGPDHRDPEEHSTEHPATPIPAAADTSTALVNGLHLATSTRWNNVWCVDR